MTSPFEVDPSNAEPLRQPRPNYQYPIEEIRSQTHSDFGVVLEQPTDWLIQQLQQNDPRIDVIHAVEEIEGKALAPVLGSGSPNMHSDAWYSLLMEGAIASKLDEDFAGEDVVAMRSVQASVDGTVSQGNLEVWDIREILNNGDILNRSRVNVAGFKPGFRSPGQLPVHPRVMQYANITDFFRKIDLGECEGSDRVFPALLIYDKDILEAGGQHSGVYGWKLPEDTEVRQSIISKAYLLDAVIKND